MKKIYTKKILEKNYISEDVFELKVEMEETENPEPGQFVNIYVKGKENLLPRPISISDFQDDVMSLVIKKKGMGTEKISKLEKGDYIKISSPLGNGFHTVKNNKNLKAAYILVGGGIGIAPLVKLEKELKSENAEVKSILGFKDEVFLTDRFENPIVVTEDGSEGMRGRVTDILEKWHNNGMIGDKHIIITCGPKPMLKKIKDIFKGEEEKLIVSLEERLGCGFGACVGCSIPTTSGLKKICKDGPVFWAHEIMWDRAFREEEVQIDVPEGKNVYQCQKVQSYREMKHDINKEAKDIKKDNCESLMATELFGEKLNNPILTASGTFSIEETPCFYNPEILGAIVTKGISIEPWEGNLLPRIAEVENGILNSVGLENKGVKDFVSNIWPKLQRYNVPKIINVAGHSIEDYIKAVEALDDIPALALEINISCPNLDAGGMAFGIDPDMVYRVVRNIREITDKKLIVKLSPNVGDIGDIAVKAEEGGADGISLINTLTGLKIDPRTGKDIMARGSGGLSGPCIKPVALNMVSRVRERVELPIIGMGGIATGEDAAEFIMAGANLTAVGTRALIEPDAPLRIIRELSRYMQEMGFKSVKEIREFYLNNKRAVFKH